MFLRRLCSDLNHFRPSRLIPSFIAWSFDCKTSASKAFTVNLLTLSICTAVTRSSLSIAFLMAEKVDTTFCHASDTFAICNRSFTCSTDSIDVISALMPSIFSSAALTACECWLFSWDAAWVFLRISIFPARSFSITAAFTSSLSRRISSIMRGSLK